MLPTRREFIAGSVAAIIANAMPAAAPEIRVFLMGDCDFIAASSKEEAQSWYRGWCGVLYPLDDIHEWDDRDSFSEDRGLQKLTFRQAIEEHALYRGTFPEYLATDGHYC